MKKDIQTIAEIALNYANQQGCTQAEVSIYTGTGASINVRQQQLESIEKHNDAQIALTVYDGQRLGAASSADLSKQSVMDTVNAALSIAKYTATDECHGLADAGLMAVQLKDLQLYHSWDISVEAMVELARECENTALGYHKKITNSEGASIDTYSGESVYANSHGFCSFRKASQHSISCSVIASHSNQMQRDYWYDSNRNASLLADANAIGEIAAKRTVARLGARKIPSTQVPVIFDAATAKSLFAHFFSAVSGVKIYKKASFLIDSIEKKVFSDFISIAEHPHQLGGANSAVHDSEGVAIPQRRSIVQEGVLQSYLLSAYSARKLNASPTGHAGGVRNVEISHSEVSQAQLIKEMGTGLLITELIGSGINLVTGDYSRGAAGFWVENGEITYPVEEITIAGNLATMFNDIALIANDIDRRGNIHCGSTLLNKLTIAGS